MPNSTGYTTADLQVLRAAFASGVRRVQFENRLMEYRSLDEMERIIQTVQGDINKQAAIAPGRQVRVWSSKGFSNCG